MLHHLDIYTENTIAAFFVKSLSNIYFIRKDEILIEMCAVGLNNVTCEYTWRFSVKKNRVLKVTLVCILHFNASLMSSYPVNLNSCAETSHSHAEPTFHIAYINVWYMLQPDRMGMTRV